MSSWTGTFVASGRRARDLMTLRGASCLITEEEERLRHLLSPVVFAFFLDSVSERSDGVVARASL